MTTESKPAADAGRGAAMELRKEAKEFRSYLDDKMDLLSGFCRTGGVQADALVRCAELAYRGDEKVRNRKSWPSIYLSLVAAAQLDLEPAGPMAEAHLVPFFDKKVGAYVFSLMPGYRGLIKLAIQSGLVTSVRAHVVYANDHCKIFPADGPGSAARVEHEIAGGFDRGAEIGVYAIARMKDDTVEVEAMSWADVEKIAEQAQRGGKETPAWKLWPDQMARKTVIKRLSKQLPLGERYYQAARIDDTFGDLDELRRILDVDDDGKVGQVIDMPSRTASAGRLVSKLKDKVAQRVAAEAPKGGEPEHDPGTGEVVDVESEEEAPEGGWPACPKCGGPNKGAKATCSDCWGAE